MSSPLSPHKKAPNRSWGQVVSIAEEKGDAPVTGAGLRAICLMLVAVDPARQKGFVAVAFVRHVDAAYFGDAFSEGDLL